MVTRGPWRPHAHGGAGARKHALALTAVLAVTETQTRRAATTAVGRKRVQSGGTLQGHVHTSFIHGFMNERLRACACACAPTEGVACAVASDMTAVAVPIEEGEQQRA